MTDQSNSNSKTEVRVMISGGFAAAYLDLVPLFEKETGMTAVTIRGPSMGTTEDAIPLRLARGEKADVLIMVGEALTGLIDKGLADGKSRVDLGRDPIGAAVRSGSPKPDISTVEALRNALLAAKSVAYSDSASGTYVKNQLFKRLGIEDQMKEKAHMIPETPVGTILAEGKAELGFQQLSELMPISGIDVLGIIPDEVQKYTVLSAALTTNAPSPSAGKSLIAFLGSAASAPVIRKTGLNPLASNNK